MAPLLASTFTLGAGDLLAIVGIVGSATAFIVLRLAQVPVKVEKAIRKHEARCHSYTPNETTAPRGHRIPVDLQDTAT